MSHPGRGVLTSAQRLRVRSPSRPALPLAPECSVSYVHHRVAVYGALPGTLTAEWQCESHCHSLLSVPAALPLGPERTDTVRSMPSGSEERTATRPGTCHPARSPPSGSVRSAAQHAHRRVAV